MGWTNLRREKNYYTINFNLIHPPILVQLGFHGLMNRQVDK